MVATKDLVPFSQLTGKPLDLPATASLVPGPLIKKRQPKRDENGVPVWVDGVLEWETVDQPMAVPSHINEPAGLATPEYLEQTAAAADPAAVAAEQTGDQEEAPAAAGKKQCPFCDGEFTDLRRHIRRQHKDEDLPPAA